jgi:hypothetical protein
MTSRNKSSETMTATELWIQSEQETIRHMAYLAASARSQGLMEAAREMQRCVDIARRDLAEMTRTR